MPRFLAAISLLLVGLVPYSVLALGLGEIDLKSALNQPFRADIPVTSESADDLSGLAVELASASTFDEFGLDRAAFLAAFKFEVLNQGSDAVIRITSVNPVVEPFVTLLLEIRWTQGRLLREYTVLLDPPVFAADVAQPAIETPVAGPAPSPVQVAPAPAPTPVETRAPIAPPPPAVPSQPVTGGNYGPVQRNDTLWDIAGRYAEGTSVNRNQMMLAIYRVNPEAFVGNINRLKAGMILRIPDAGELDALGRGEANAEVRRQNAEWKGEVDESRQLRLVPPPETDAAADAAAQATTGAADADVAADMAGMQSRIDELEAEVSDSRRLIELRDQELRDLQEQLANIEEQAAPTDITDIAPIEPEPEIEPLPADGITTEETTDIEAEVPADATEDAGDALAEPEPLPGPGVVVTTSPQEESSFIAQLFGSIWLYISLAIVLLLGWLLVRRRAAADGPADSWDRLEPDVDEFDEAAAMASAGLGGAAAAEDPSFVVEEQTGREEEAEDDSPFADTQARPEHEFAVDAEEPESPLERTISAESAVNLDQADPIAEADFHMAYGLYDQAADLLTEALEAEPERKELRLKLLEVYFIWENQGGFLKEAQNLHQNIDADSDPDWNKVLIMGKQICPAEELFAAAPSAPGEEGEIDLAFGEEAELGEDAEIDITFGAADENVDLLFGEDDDDDMIDFDLTGQELSGIGDSPTEETPTVEVEPAGESTLETPTVESAMLDRGLDDADGISTMETPTVESSLLGRGFDDADAESTMETPTIESPAVASTTMETPTVENPAVSTTMETPTIETEAGDWGEEDSADEPVEQTAEMDLDDLALDLADVDDSVAVESGLAAVDDEIDLPDFDNEPSPLDETGLKPQISGAEAGSDFDDDDSEADAAVRGLLDVEPTAQMQSVDLESFSSDTVEQPAPGDTVEQPAVDDTAEQPAVLDIGEEIAATDSPTGTLDRSGAAVVEGATMTEVGTKLDLARAYIDMGDPDGARSILNEVLEEAVDSQRQEAQKLLDDLDD